MKRLLLSLLLLTSSLQADDAYIVANFTISDIPVAYSFAKQAGIEIHDQPAWNDLSSFQATAGTIIVWNSVLPATLPLFQREDKKPIFFNWEPVQIDPTYYSLFSRVYTWDDTLVDNKFYFKFYYPFLMPMIMQPPAFEDKKFCVMIASHWTNDRLEMIKFFETKQEGEFHFYGYKKHESKTYQGAIPGGHSGNDKVAVLKDYRFCICFENTPSCAGYITEKIFGCFAAGCVPVYWGAPNVEQYIPKNCYVDYRDFSSHEELYQHLKGMSKETYESYLANIRAFIKSDQAKVFTPAYFDRLIYDAITL
jgi:hypothetical protein